jgi:hypothetical protein
MPIAHTHATSDAMRNRLIVLTTLAVLLLAQAAIWLPFLPNAAGKVSVDFSLWLPDLLAGTYWHLQNGIFSLPWFSPSQCGGIPFHADPQVAYLSITQFLAFLVPPLAAVQISFLLFSAAGFAGMFVLARRCFALSLAAALLAAGLFMLNGFFAVRMVVGHLTYAPFMLLPAFGACLLRPQGSRPARRAEEALRCLMGGLILAIAIQAGMVHVIPPGYVTLVAVLLMHGLMFGGSAAPFLRLAVSTAIGLALCAGKLAASLALLSHFPRDAYPLPGIPGLFHTVWIAAQSLFLLPTDAMTHAIVNSHLVQEQQEFEYGVSIVPLVLMVAAATLWRPRMTRRRLLPAVALIVLLAVPITVNLYVPGWNAFLKSLPFFGNSSTLLRWFSAYILPSVLGGAMALDALTKARPRAAAFLAAAGIAIMLATTAFADHSHYGPGHLGFYDASAIDTAWRSAEQKGTPPPIFAVATLRGADGQILMAPERDNALTVGLSQLLCYEPLFGYRLEQFPIGTLHRGRALDVLDGEFNFKNPACYVFPGANQCKPGDAFPAASQAALQAFLEYRPLDFAKPWWAHAADWLSLLTLMAAIPAAGWASWRLIKGRAFRFSSPFHRG